MYNSILPVAVLLLLFFPEKATQTSLLLNQCFYLSFFHHVNCLELSERIFVNGCN